MHARIIAIITALLITAFNAPAGAAEAVWKVVAVTDGDTIVMAKQDTQAVKIRLADIDAPEHDQPYGQEATIALKKLLDGCEVHFMPVAIDHYGRQVALITACGRNVNAEMVRQGLAWVYTRYNTDTALPPLQVDAQADRRGLWADPHPIQPEKWRHHQ